MKLIKLTLTNFKGIKHFEFEPNGQNVSVYGTNASGKTTLFDALTWLLFDKGSDWGENFSPKTKDKSGAEVHNINNRVDGVFSLDDGRIISFSKDQSENWVKKRGGTTESFAGNTTEYFIDGVPVKCGEYKSRLDEICSISFAQILTQPLYFPEILDWKSRRKILLDVCGDVTEFDVINQNDKLREISRFLLIPGTDGQFYSVDECAKVYDSKSKSLRQRLEEIPSRIDEATRALISSDADKEVLNNTLSILQKDLDEALSKRAMLKEKGIEGELRGAISQIKADMAEGKATFENDKNTRLSEDREAIASLTAKWEELLIQKSGLSASISLERNKIMSLTSQREQLAQQYDDIKNQTWQGDTVCPTCKRELEADKIEAAKEKFNTEKAAKLEEIRSKIEKSCSKAMISEHQDKLTVLERSYEVINKETEQLSVEMRVIREKISSVEQERYECTEHFKKMAEKIAEIEAQIISGINDISPEQNEIEAEINRIKRDMEGVQLKLSILKTNEQQKNRIAELENEEKKLHQELEDAEYCLYLCGEFIKAKVSMLNDKINAKFENVRFKLFEQQINGEIKEACEVLVPADNLSLVPFSMTNDAAKLNAGLEIIDTLSNFWGISMPVVVDNAESVVKLKNIAPQVIRLVVSGADETLRVEVE